MTQDEITEMAKKCGWNSPANNMAPLYEFAKLVAAKATDEANARANASWTLMCKKMVKAELEACLQIQEDWQYTYANDLVQKIRARGEAQ